MKAADTPYVLYLEFRPDDLASPRGFRVGLTIFLQNLDHYQPAARAWPV